jgi:hypothetical protein
VSAGHDALDPVQFSATSHEAEDGRQTVLDDAKPSAGQLSPEPVQVSATSQMPAEVRQIVLEDFFTSGGQRSLEPLQTSWRSHTPAAGGRPCPTLLQSAGHVSIRPSQVSATSTRPPEGRQTVAVLALRVGGHAVSTPSQKSVCVADVDRRTAEDEGAGCAVGRAAGARAGAALGRVAQSATPRRRYVSRLEASAGHAGPLPVQSLGDVADAGRRRHWSSTARSRPPDSSRLRPVHSSATSQTPAAERQTVPDGSKPSAGHTELLPVQFSATVARDRSPERQVVEDDAKPSAGHASLDPVQFSGDVADATDERQGRRSTAERVGRSIRAEPSQLSATSHTPRRCGHVPDGANPSGRAQPSYRRCSSRRRRTRPPMSDDRRREATRPSGTPRRTRASSSASQTLVA